MLAEWLEEKEELVLDHDEELGNMVENLTGNKPGPLIRLCEINLTHQPRRRVDPQEKWDEPNDDNASLSSSI